MDHPEPISWNVARRVASTVGGHDPFERSYLYDSLARDFEELTPEAEALVSAATGMNSLAGPARSRVVNRAEWVDVSLAGFRRLLRPLSAKMNEHLTGPLAPIGRSVVGTQVGTMLGWMSSRVLGQYDLLVLDDEHPEEQDWVYFVGPNILSLEKRFAFPPRQFRLWIALHEVTHRMQFTGNEWLRPYYLSMVGGMLEAGEPNPAELLENLKRAAGEVRSGRNPLDAGGLPALLATGAARERLNRVQGLMSLLEGHGDVTMDRAGAAQLSEAGRFSRVLRQRRMSGNVLLKFVQQVTGMSAKMRQYQAGEDFIEAVEASEDGPALLNALWHAGSPAMLPTMEEIDDPPLWLTRVGSLTLPV